MKDNEFIYLMDMRDLCVKKALMFRRAGELYLFRFWGNASRCYEERARGEYKKESSIDVLKSHVDRAWSEAGDGMEQSRQA